MQVREGAVTVTVTPNTEETARVTDSASSRRPRGRHGDHPAGPQEGIGALVPGETLLESARRAGLQPPFSCEAGNCGTCMARLVEGHATMRVNEALDDDEVAEGYILTCQGVPDTDSITVRYE